MMLAFNCYLVRVWILWFQYKLTVQKDSLAKPLTEKSRTVVGMVLSKTPDTKWYLEHKHYMGDEFLLKLFLTKSGLETIALLSTFAFVRGLRDANFTTGEEVWCESLSIPLWLTLVMAFYTSIAVVYAAYRFGEVEDGFFLKRELKYAGAAALFGAIIWLGLHYLVPQPLARVLASGWVCILEGGIIFLSGVYPISKTYTMGERKMPAEIQMSSNSSEKFSSLEDVLRSYDGRERFRAHLKLEFAVENLMFWEAVEEFRKEYDETDPDYNMELGARVMRRFINDDAPLQVNIAHRTSQELLSGFESGKESLAMNFFDKAQGKIFQLMALDNFISFKRRRRELMSMHSIPSGPAIASVSHQSNAKSSRESPPKVANRNDLRRSNTDDLQASAPAHRRSDASAIIPVVIRTGSEQEGKSINTSAEHSDRNFRAHGHVAHRSALLSSPSNSQTHSVRFNVP